MVNALFLEDGDLLENIMISNQIHESKFEEFNRLISEQEMMISLYESQQLLIEQDTQIFMHLRYNTEVLSEGVLENIGKGIMAVLRKIGELISNFIGFIFGRRKKDKSIEKEMKKIEDNEEKIVESIKETEKELKIVSSEFEASINKAKKAGVDEDKILKTKEDIDEFFLGNKEEKYQVIKIDEDAMRKLNITGEWSELEEMIKVLEDCVAALRRNDPNGIPKSLHDKYIKYLDSLKGGKKSDLTTILITPAMKCDRETYYKEYYKKAKAFYKNYNDESIKNLESLKRLKAKIDNLTKSIKNIEMYNTDKNPAWIDATKTISRMVSSLSTECNLRIQTLVNVEKGYQAYKNNMKLTTNEYLKSNRTVKKVSKDIKDMNFDEFDKHMSNKNSKLVFGKDSAYFLNIDTEDFKKFLDNGEVDTL